MTSVTGQTAMHSAPTAKAAGDPCPQQPSRQVPPSRQIPLSRRILGSYLVLPGPMALLSPMARLDLFG